MSQSKAKNRRPAGRKRQSRWPLLLLLGGILLAAAAIALSLLGSRSQPGQVAAPEAPSLSITAIERSPEAQVDGLKVDFGDMKMGVDVASLQLTVRNSGAGRLQFSQAPYVELAAGC